MHKWNMFKRTAPIALSLVVAATSMPGTVLAADAFEDGTVVEAEAIAAEPETAEPETAEPETAAEPEAAEAEETETAAQEAEEEISEASDSEISVFDSGDEAVFADSEDAEEVFASEAASEYTYLYAGLTWNEYWLSEGVYAAGNTTSSAELDTKKETDKGGFDTVTRATTNHGLHRGSYQMMTTIIAEDGSTYEVASWADNGATLVLTDGSTVGYSKGTITKADGSTTTLKSYIVTGIKYVPVKVKTSDLEAFKAKYRVVENGGAMAGGYSEKKLGSYTAVAKVTEDTNGLKTATKNADGSFSFSARKTGSGSGVENYTATSGNGDTVTKGETAIAASGLEPAVHTDTKTMGSFGEFLRVNILGNYGDLGANMQAVRWDYYGSSSTVLRSFGTKFAADNWMHSQNGIQLGLTNSIRCQLPEGTDGTGKWVITLYALGYQDTTIEINVTSDQLVTGNLVATEAQLTEAKDLMAKAEALKASDYTAASWSYFQTELGEMKELLAGDTTTLSAPTLNEQISHLTSAMADLVKPSLDIAKTVVNLNLKKSTTLKPVLTGIDSVTYKSSKSSVASVTSKGKVTGKKTGTAVITITAKAGSQTLTKKVTVYVNEKLTLAKSSASIKVKGKTTIKATSNIKGTITYTSSNTKVATVSSKGVVKGVKKGTAKITVACNGKTKTFKVTVK